MKVPPANPAASKCHRWADAEIHCASTEERLGYWLVMDPLDAGSFLAGRMLLPDSPLRSMSPKNVTITAYSILLPHCTG